MADTKSILARRTMPLPRRLLGSDFNDPPLMGIDEQFKARYPGQAAMFEKFNDDQRRWASAQRQRDVENETIA